jgi:hypothetical protein
LPQDIIGQSLKFLKKRSRTHAKNDWQTLKQQKERIKKHCGVR